MTSSFAVIQNRPPQFHKSWQHVGKISQRSLSTPAGTKPGQLTMKGAIPRLPVRPWIHHLFAIALTDNPSWRRSRSIVGGKDDDSSVTDTKIVDLFDQLTDHFIDVSNHRFIFTSTPCASGSSGV